MSATPPPLMADPDTLRTELPAQMQAAPRWLLWRPEPGKPGEKARKVPYYADGTQRHGILDGPADLGRLVTLGGALRALEQRPGFGLGFALGPDGSGNCWQGIDLDHVESHPGHAELVEMLPGYREQSPSGTGYHAIGYGPPFLSLGSNATGIEAYASGRYFTVTGHAVGGDIEDLAPFVNGTLEPLHRVPGRGASHESKATVRVTDATVVELRSALNSIPVDDYDTWIAMGHALAELGDVGKGLWLDWSQMSAKWQAGDAGKWDTCTGDESGYRVVFSRAQQGGWVNPASKAASRGAARQAWGEMEPLPMALAPVMPFDCELLPSALRPWIEDIAERMQCPPDYPAVAAMVALAAVVGRQVAIRPKARDDWSVVPNLWGAVIGRPALLKTPALQEPLRMIGALEAQARDEFEQGQHEHAADEMLREADAKEGKIMIAKALKDGNRERARGIALEATEVVTPPARRRYLTQDTTIEKLGELLRDNPRGVLVFRDELVGFLKTLDQEGREGSRAFFLESWNGTGSYTFDRIGRGTVEVEAACVSIIGAIQPGPFKDYMVGAVAGGAGDDGLVQRFQMAVWPDTGREWVNVDRWPNTQARQEAKAIFQRLDTLDPAALGTQQGEGDPVPWLRFSAEAQAKFNAWREDLEFRIRDDDLHPAMESHLAKYRSLVPSLALLTHLADAPEAGSVGLDSLLRALAWSEYLESHARRIYGPALAPELYAARELAKRLDTLPDPFTAKEVYRKHWRGLDLEGTSKAIQVLIDFGHIRAVTPDERQEGRPTTWYEVHPDLRREAP